MTAPTAPVKADACADVPDSANAIPMTDKTIDDRKERLAAQLRANLRRRKAQGREMAEEEKSAEPKE